MQAIYCQRANARWEGWVNTEDGKLWFYRDSLRALEVLARRNDFRVVVLTY